MRLECGACEDRAIAKQRRLAVFTRPRALYNSGFDSYLCCVPVCLGGRLGERGVTYGAFPFSSSLFLVAGVLPRRRGGERGDYLRNLKFCSVEDRISARAIAAAVRRGLKKIALFFDSLTV